MNQKIKILRKIVLFVSIMVLFSNCTNDENLGKQGENSNAKLKETQKWFNKYESEGENYFLLDGLQYNWDEAKITNSEDGTETTIVPISESKKDNREFWEQRLYIYKTGKEDYKALVYEINTNKYVPLSSQSIDDGNFTGFISVWDLKTGFVRAARFENNQVIETGVVEVRFNNKGTTNKTPIEAPCIYSGYDGGCDKGSGGKDVPINLPGTVLREVPVKAPSKGSTVEYYGPRGPVIGGTDTGGYTSPGGGGINTGGGGIKAPTSEAIAAAIQKQIYADKLPPCLKKILDDLVNTNAGPGNIINKFSGNDPSYNYNWTMETGINNLGVSGNTLSRYNGVTGMTTTFDIQQFPNATELSWAKTMLHESIHAYLITYFYRNEPSFKADYPVLFQKYMETKLWNVNHHDEIAQSLRQLVADTLESYGISKGYKLDKQFYQDMAWGGLENTDAFKNLPLAERRRISATLSIELRGEDDYGNKKTQKGKKAGC